jgi:protection of telomeres protein 1
LPGSALPRITKCGTIPNPGPPEILYSITLANALSHHRAGNAAAVVSSPSQNLSPAYETPSGSSSSALRQQKASAHKFSLIHNIQSSKFYDIVGEVIKTYPSGSGVFEVYITDYTANENLFNYEWRPPSSDDFDCGGPGDEYGYLERRVKPSWSGPYGRQTLRVALWPPHSTAAQSTIKEGDYVELRNVHVKLDQHAQLEGAMHGDRRYPDRVSVQKVDKKDERYLGVLRRKKAYAKKFEKQKGDFLEGAGLSSRKRRNDDSGEGSDVAKKKPKKRGNEQKRALENREIQFPQGSQREEGKEAADLARKRRREEETRNAKGAKCSARSLKYETNKHGKLDLVGSTLWAVLTFPHLVICAHNAKPVVSVSRILEGEGRSTTTDTGVALDLPFQNVCYRAKVRVVDFFPPNLEDFAVPCDEFEDLSDDSDEESDRDDGQLRHTNRGLRRVDRWDWMFYLLVEDANKIGSGAKRETMKVLVAHRDAEYLLKMDAKE